MTRLIKTIFDYKIIKQEITMCNGSYKGNDHTKGITK